MTQLEQQLLHCVVGSVDPRFFHVVLVNQCLEIWGQKYGPLATLGSWAWHTAGLWKTIVGS